MAEDSAAGGCLPAVFGRWFAAKGWQPHRHQLEMLGAAALGQSARLSAPTGGSALTRLFALAFRHTASEGPR
ncbi:MAG: hypothetical protein HYR63_09320 [Proteobacteria bacterium]|nr:hypothetical protein [Pseudomonadota bacterium]MBI3497512.1 hypothetical protein [Pseudomonadota bacterium]